MGLWCDSYGFFTVLRLFCERFDTVLRLIWVCSDAQGVARCPGPVPQGIHDQ